MEGGWGNFINKNLDTLGVSLFFAALGSAFRLWAVANEGKEVTPLMALGVLFAGQLLGSIASCAVFGYLNWSLFLAPAIGTPCGIIGTFILMAWVRAGRRFEERSPELGDGAVNLIKKREGA